MTATSPEIACPKCGTKQPPGPACRKCGLAVERMPAFQPRDSTVAMELNDAWRACEEAWSDATVHEKFVGVVVELEAYAYAARRYRTALASRPGDPIATAHVDKLAKMVAATLLVSGTTKDAATPKPYKNVIAIFVVLVVAIIVGLVYAAVRGKTDADALAPPVNQRR